MSLQIPDTHYFSVRPHIRGRRVPVALIAYSARSEGWGTSELAYQFTLTEPQVLAALLYYEEHNVEIDQQEKQTQQEYEALNQQYTTDAELPE